MQTFATFALLLLFAWPAFAAVKGETVAYKEGETALEGFLAYDDANEDKRPGVLVVPDWMGMQDHYNEIAKKLAALGYVAFAADIYGKDVRPKTREEAGAQAGKYKKDRASMRLRVQAGLEELKRCKFVDGTRTAAIGYCFGGTCVLELARSGADVSGVVTFHGGLSTPTPEDAKNIKGKVLILHGADDPNVPPDEVAAFQDEMRKANVDWQMVFYSNAVHSFTKKSSGNDNAKGAAYNANADRRSWQAMRTFFDELFEPRK